MYLKKNQIREFALQFIFSQLYYQIDINTDLEGVLDDHNRKRVIDEIRAKAARIKGKRPELKTSEEILEYIMKNY